MVIIGPGPVGSSPRRSSWRSLVALVALQGLALGPWQSTHAQSNNAAEPRGGQAGDVDIENLQGLLPRMEFKSLRHDFGEIARGQRVNHSFEFTNTGKAVLQVRSIHSSCGCVNTRVEPGPEFAPGEKGKVSFEFDSAHFSEALVRTLTVDTNAPAPSSITLTFTANVKPEIQARPSLLALGEVAREFNKSFTVGLETAERASGGGDGGTLPPEFEKSGVSADVRKAINQTSGPVRAVAVTSSSPYIEVSLIAEGTKDPQVRLKFTGGLPIGSFREKVTVWNSSRHLKALVIPVVAEVTGHVKPSAKYLEFGVVSRPQSARRSLSLASDRSDFKVNSVEIELRRTDVLRNVRTEDLIVFRSERDEDGVVVHFDLRFPPDLTLAASSVNASGTFVVRTNDPDYKEIRVPFFGVLRQESKL